MQRFRGGLVFKAHRLCASLNSRLGSNAEKEEVPDLHSVAAVQAFTTLILQLYDSTTLKFYNCTRVTTLQLYNSTRVATL